MIGLLISLPLIAMIAVAATTPLAAQRREDPPIPASQLGSISQDVAGIRIKIVYRRPVARGRDLFGALIPFARVWTPSADSAARISVSDEVEVNGELLAAGTYGIWAIPPVPRSGPSSSTGRRRPSICATRQNVTSCREPSPPRASTSRRSPSPCLWLTPTRPTCSCGGELRSCL